MPQPEHTGKWLAVPAGDVGRSHQALPGARIPVTGRAGALVDRMVRGPPPPQLQALMTSLQAGHGLHLYIPT